MENIEIDITPRCNDGTLPPDSQLDTWTKSVLDATAKASRPLAYNTDTRKHLQQQGFVDIEEQIIKVPLNPWPLDPHMKDIGRWYNLAFAQGLEALSLGPLMRIEGWKRSKVDRLIEDVKRDIYAKRFHVYHEM